MNIAAPVVLVLGFAALTTCTAVAQSPSAVAEAQQIFEQVRGSAIAGPAAIPLAAKGVLNLPAGHVFLPQPQAGRLFRAMGSPATDPSLLGLVFPQAGQDWYAIVRHDDSGHVLDAQARDWDEDVLLEALRDDAQASNVDRARLGVPQIEIEGWAEKPAYDPVTHRLVWATFVRLNGAAAGAQPSVNYNTFLLGREGYYAMSIITLLKDLPAGKAAVHAMLAALDFDDGRRYADFDARADRTATHGLGALVVGPTNELAVVGGTAGLFLIQHGKATLVGLVALCVGAVALFRRGVRGRRSAASPVA